MARHELTLHRAGKKDIVLTVDVLGVVGENVAAESEKRLPDGEGQLWPPIDDLVVYDTKTLRSYLGGMFEGGSAHYRTVAFDSAFARLCRFTGNSSSDDAFTVDLDKLGASHV
jgi:hypothetical protein